MVGSGHRTDETPPSFPSPPDAFAPARLGPVELRNRIVKAATHEGLARDGQVTDDLIAFHLAPSRGGVGMTTLAYCCASPEGRTYRDQIVVGRHSLDGLTRFTDAVHETGAKACMQLGHAGWFANPAEMRAPAIGPSRLPNPHAIKLTSRATTDDLERLRRDFRNAAALAVEAGFDAIEVHLGHGYLLSQFLSPFTNRRRDAYGGSIANRARFPREVVRAVREGAGTSVAVTVKLNMTDGFRGGLTVEDGIEVARLLAKDVVDGSPALDALQLTGGFTARTPMFLLRGEPLLPRIAEHETDPVRRLALQAGSLVLREDTTFREGFLRDHARRFLGVGLPLMLLGGITRRDTIEQAMFEGFEFVAIARALIHDPDLVDRMQAGELDASGCIPCNGCILEMERGHGAQCVRLPVDQRPGISPGRAA